MESLYWQLYEPHNQPVKGLRLFLQNLHLNQIPIAMATSAPPVNV